MKFLSKRLRLIVNNRCLLLLLLALPLSNCKTLPETPSTEPVPSDDKPPMVTAFVESEIAASNAQTNDSEQARAKQSQDPNILVTGKSLNAVQIGTSESPRNDGIHDPINDAIVVLQDPSVAMKDFPRDRRQQVDWVQALAQGYIEPRADLRGESKITELDLDILMKNTQFMPWVKFPHDRHTKWLACSNCHPAIFQAKENANPISMNKVLRGEYCGVCHDKVAFALFTCERCHSVPHEGSGPKWW